MSELEQYSKTPKAIQQLKIQENENSQSAQIL